MLCGTGINVPKPICGFFIGIAKKSQSDLRFSRQAMSKPKILIFKLGLLGDVLMTTPFVRQLRRIYPDAEIQFWVGDSYRVALDGNPHLSSVVGFDEQMFFRHNIRQVYRLWRKLKKERFTVAFLLGKNWIFNALAKSLGIPRRIGFVREPISRFFLTEAVRYSDIRHEIYYYLDLLSFCGNPDFSDTKMEVTYPPDTDQVADRILSKRRLDQFVGVINSGGNNAGETQFVKRLPDEFFEKLVNVLCRKQTVVLLGNRADGAHYSRFKFPANLQNLGGALSFHESLAVMKRATRIFTADCGGMHMAAAVNDRLTTFFGPTHPERTGPLLPEVEVVWPNRDRYSPEYNLFNSDPTSAPSKNLPIRLLARRSTLPRQLFRFRGQT